MNHFYEWMTSCCRRGRDSAVKEQEKSFSLFTGKEMSEPSASRVSSEDITQMMHPKAEKELKYFFIKELLFALDTDSVYSCKDTSEMIVQFFNKVNSKISKYNTLEIPIFTTVKIDELKKSVIKTIYYLKLLYS